VSTADGGAPVLDVDGVSLSFGSRLVLDDVRFALGAGELVGLIGSNGAGKTTLLRVILGLLRPDRGAVRRPGGVGYVPQRLVVDPDAPLRAVDLVALGLDGERYGPRLRSAARKARVEEMLDAVDATAFANSRVGTLSGGELQRVLVAHALVADPPLLLMDEPLANLDIASSAEIVELVARLAADKGVTVLLSAHDMNALLAHMARVVYLAGGRAASGTTAEVVRSDVLTELYGYPVRVLEVDGSVVVLAGGRVVG
jgi:zinc/manganese transport system ATP-binding protein